MNVHLIQNLFHANVLMESEIDWIMMINFGENMRMKMNHVTMKNLQNF